MVAKTIPSKKNFEIVKEELLNLLRESDTVKERKFNIQNIINHREDTDITKGCKDNKILDNTRTDAEKV